MSDISKQVAGFLRESEGLPPFRRNKDGLVEGWPEGTVKHLSELVSRFAYASRRELCEAILEIENAHAEGLPDGILVLLSRAAWDAPQAPDAVKVSSAINQGKGLRAALFGTN